MKDSLQLRRSLLPWLIATCSKTDDIATLHRIQQIQDDIRFNTLLPSGSMPLHVCAKYGAINCANFLLRSGVDEKSSVNTPDQAGFSALYYAILQDNHAMIDLLVRNKASLNATFKPSEIGMFLCNCVKSNQMERLKAWHRAGADLDQADYDGRTPILIVNLRYFLLRIVFIFSLQAVNYNAIDCIRYLLEHGNIDVNWPDNRGLTPIQIAKQRGFDAIVELLSSYATNAMKI